MTNYTHSQKRGNNDRKEKRGRGDTEQIRSSTETYHHVMQRVLLHDFLHHNTVHLLHAPMNIVARRTDRGCVDTATGLRSLLLPHHEIVHEVVVGVVPAPGPLNPLKHPLHSYSLPPPPPPLRPCSPRKTPPLRLHRHGRNRGPTPSSPPSSAPTRTRGFSTTSRP